MPHIIETISESLYQKTINILVDTHLAIAKCIVEAQKNIYTKIPRWEINTKRLEIELPSSIPYVGKYS